jgi:nitroreductase
MLVSDALGARYSCRAYLPDPVPEATVRSILTQAARAPSGGNVQPWRVWAVTGEALSGLIAQVLKRIQAGQFADGEPEYFIYPPEISEPYAARRFRNGEAFYEALGVKREDYAGRIANYVRNYEFFDAPVGLFFAIDRQMQQGQWTELGMYMQSVMLLAKARGLDTVALESWSFWHNTVKAALGIPDNLILFAGMALGHADLKNPITAFRTDRAPLEEFAEFAGFAPEQHPAQPALVEA